MRHNEAMPVPAFARPLAACAALLLAACSPKPGADASNPQLVARGKAVYDQHCASCHGAKLEGQPNWRDRLPNGRLPAPPHDPGGHTWHHSDEQLFEVTKKGLAALVPGYESDMPPYEGKLPDADIWAVLAYIKSTWPEDIRRRQEQLNNRAKAG